MSTFEEFREELREALGRLSEPDFRPAASLYGALGCDPALGPSAVQSLIERAIHSLQPEAALPPDARVRREYEVLHHRYILGLTQEETADRLSLSDRSVRRVQREATHQLARFLWESGLARAAQQDLSRAAQPDAGRAATGPGQAPVAEGASWQQQLLSELSSLQASAPQTIAEVGPAIQYAVRLQQAVAGPRGVTISAGATPAGLSAAVHPSVLRQLLSIVIGELARAAPAGEIRAWGEAAGNRISLQLDAPGPAAEPSSPGSVVRDILGQYGGSLAVSSLGPRQQVTLQLPAAGVVTVLAIDDNADIVRFYQRCTAGTRYRLVEAAYGERTTGNVRALAPAAILLDILLPDVDGWQLLGELQADVRLRQIPVIICSIIPDEHLALAMGAAAYLPKPVQRAALISALDRVLQPA